MRTIHFKNGDTKEVEQEIVDLMIKYQNMKASKFEVFTNLDGVNYLVINVDEILYID